MQLPSRLFQRLLPVLLFAAAFFGTYYLDFLPTSIQALLAQNLPVISLSMAFLLSFQFKRSRLSFLLSFYTFSSYLYVFDSTFSLNEKYFISIALSLLAFWFSLFKDRDLLSIHGLMRLLLIALVIGVTATIARTQTTIIDFFTDWQILQGFSWAGDFQQLPTLLMTTIGICIIGHVFLALVPNENNHAIFLCGQLYLLISATSISDDMLSPIMLTALALIVSIAILFASYDMAYRDELTSLPSRRALNQRLLSLGRKYSIAMLDIDHFKKFNDTHGHDIGDEVLKMVASKIGNVTGGGKAFRYGGEEFTVVFSGKSPSQVEAHLDALRQTIEDYAMIIRQSARPEKQNNKQAKTKRGKNKARENKSLSVTISIGLAEKNKANKTPEQVIKAADDALYRAKKAGRNCVSR